MTLRLNERTLSKVLLVPTAVVVITLAFLQYRWSKQVSEATSVRLADSLQMSMINWHLNLFRDLSDVCIGLRIDSTTGRGVDLDEYVRRFGEWKASAVYPNLVSGLYLLGVGQSPRARALRLDSGNGRFEPSEWPAAFAPLRSALERFPPRAAGERDSFNGALYTAGERVTGWRFEPSVPAFLHPLRSDHRVGPVEENDRRGVEWIVVELDRDVLRSRILPDLARRYFAGVDGLDYQVAVLTGPPPGRVLFSSDPDFGAGNMGDFDGRMDLFGRASVSTRDSSIRLFHKPSDDSSLAASVGTFWFPLLRPSGDDQGWELVVRHRRGGPLGAFVEEMHRRDLNVSLGVLLLLVISVAMLIVLSNRAQRLAILQMDFVTAVTHELRTPLTIISSAADNIADGIVRGPQQLAQYGSVIGAEARRLSGMVEEILLFAAIKEGHQRYAITSLDVADLIDTTLAATRDLVHASQFALDRDIEPNLPPVMGDSVALSQCLQNLLTNALKYGRAERWIGIRARVVDADDGREVQISVSDRGPGIGDADLPHVFKPFYRSPSVATQVHGTGLGLALAKSIAEAMRGHLTVTSVPGRGSTFTLHLPCADTSGAPSEAAPALLANGRM